jgi:hypothetical protein
MPILSIIGGLFGGMSLVARLITIGVIITTLGGIYAGWHIHVYRNGYRAAIAAIAKEDAKAVARATEFRSVLRDCRARGLRWDQSTGKCDGG